MADNNIGRASGYLAVGVVVSVDDPWQQGNVKVRWRTGAASQDQLGDDDLPWTKSMFPSTNPSLGQVGGPHTGMRVGSVVYGMPHGGDGQDFLIVGTGVKGGTGEPDEKRTEDSDIPRAAKSDQVDGIDQPRYGDVNDVAKKHGGDDVVRTSIVKYAQDEAGPDKKPAKYPDLPDSIGTQDEAIA